MRAHSSTPTRMPIDEDVDDEEMVITPVGGNSRVDKRQRRIIERKRERERQRERDKSQYCDEGKRQGTDISRTRCVCVSVCVCGKSGGATTTSLAAATDGFDGGHSQLAIPSPLPGAPLVSLLTLLYAFIYKHCQVKAVDVKDIPPTHTPSSSSSVDSK